MKRRSHILLLIASSALAWATLSTTITMMRAD